MEETFDQKERTNDVPNPDAHPWLTIDTDLEEEILFSLDEIRI